MAFQIDTLYYRYNIYYTKLYPVSSVFEHAWVIRQFYNGNGEIKSHKNPADRAAPISHLHIHLLALSDT